MSMDGTWIDGYLPGIDRMQELAGRYKHVPGTVPDYTLDDAKLWTQEQLFGSMAATFRGYFDRDKLPSGTRPAPCSMWLAQFSREPHDPRIKPLYEEWLADPRRDDYFHLISIHDECPVAEECLRNTLGKLEFESRSGDTYENNERFQDAVYELLTWYVDVMAAPWLEVHRQIAISSQKLATAGP